MHRCCFAFQRSLDFLATFPFQHNFIHLQKEPICLAILAVSIQLFNSNMKLVLLVDIPVLVLIITFILLLKPFFEETCLLEEDLQTSFDLYLRSLFGNGPRAFLWSLFGNESESLSQVYCYIHRLVSL